VRPHNKCGPDVRVSRTQRHLEIFVTSNMEAEKCVGIRANISLEVLG